MEISWANADWVYVIPGIVLLLILWILIGLRVGAISYSEHDVEDDE